MVRTSTSIGCEPRRLRTAAPVREANSAGESDVIILDQHSVRKIEPMIQPAAAAHRVLIDQSQAGRGLARHRECAPWCHGNCVQNFRVKVSDSTHALRRKFRITALARENHPRIYAGSPPLTALCAAHSVEI